MGVKTYSALFCCSRFSINLLGLMYCFTIHVFLLLVASNIGLPFVQDMLFELQGLIDAYSYCLASVLMLVELGRCC
jgi:hypothetical protein